MPTCRASALRRLVNDTPKADSRANSPSRSDEIPLLKIKHLCLRSHLILSIESQDLSQFGLLCPQQHQQVRLPTSILSASINYTSRCVGKLVCPRACCTSGRWGHIGATSGPRTTGPHIRDPIRSSTGPPMHVRRRFRACQREGPGRCRQQRRDLAGIGGVSQRTSASTRTALAAAALAEPLGEALPDGRAGLLGDLQQEGSQRLAQDLHEASREQPPQGSSPHAGAETNQRYRLQRWNPGNEKAPRMRETLRVGGPVWAHSDDYMPECDNRSSHRSSSLVNGGRPSSGRRGIRSIRAPKATASISASKWSRRWAGMRFLVAVRCPLRWRPMVWLTVALTTVGVGATALSGDQDPDVLLPVSAHCAFPAASTAARQLDLGSQGRPFVGDYRRFDRTHPFWVMLPWPPHGTMTATTPDGKRIGRGQRRHAMAGTSTQAMDIASPAEPHHRLAVVGDRDRGPARFVRVLADAPDLGPPGHGRGTGHPDGPGRRGRGRAGHRRPGQPGRVPSRPGWPPGRPLAVWARGWSCCPATRTPRSGMPGCAAAGSCSGWVLWAGPCSTSGRSSSTGTRRSGGSGRPCSPPPGPAGRCCGRSGGWPPGGR